MTLPLIIYRSLRQHALSTVVTAGRIALACGLLMCVWAVAGVIRAQTGVVLEVWHWQRVLGICPVAMIALGALGGVVPAFKAYRTPVAETLAPVS